MSKRNRLPIDPLYHVEAQSLKRNEARRIGRYALSPFNRAARYPLDEFEWERKQQRELVVLDFVMYSVFVVILICLIAVVVR